MTEKTPPRAVYALADDVRNSLRYCSRRLWGSQGAGVAFTDTPSHRYHHGTHDNGQRITLIRGRNWGGIGN